jgi:hypothetical protein
VQKSFEISHVNVELKTSVSEISIIRVDIVNHHTSQMYLFTMKASNLTGCGMVLADLQAVFFKGCASKMVISYERKDILI